MKSPSPLIRNISMVCSVALGGTLLIAGVSELNTAARFAEIIANYRILGAVGSQFLAVVLPWCEVCTGLLLLVRIWPRASGITAALLFTMFGIAVSSALIRGLNIECGCFGTSSGARVGLKLLAIDLGGLAASAFVIGVAEELDAKPTLSTVVSREGAQNAER